MKNHIDGSFTNTICDYLSIQQIKYDCATVYSLIMSMQRDGITSFGVLPYISLVTSSILEFVGSSVNTMLSKIDILRIQDVRLKLKVFEDGFSKSKRMVLNIDYLQDQVFRDMLKYKFLKSLNTHYNLGIYTDAQNRVVGNTQYNNYLLQDNRFLKKSVKEVANSYSLSPDKFNMNEQTEKDMFEYAYKCGQVIASAHIGLSADDIPLSVAIKSNTVKYRYVDLNTNTMSLIFPFGEDGKATWLYLLHILSTINFLLYVMNGYILDDYGWWLKINYIVYYYAIHKLLDLQRYLIDKKLLNQNISDCFNAIGLDHTKFMSVPFRNYAMHSQLKDKNGEILISIETIDQSKPLFGLVETCFAGMTYEELKSSVRCELAKISSVLSQWLGVQALRTKPSNE